MPKPFTRSWTCLQCVRQQQKGRRCLATAAATVASKSNLHVLSHTSATATHDDTVLRDVFDSKRFWDAYSTTRNPESYSRRSVGLFQNQYLREPSGFEEYAEVTVEKCRKIVAKVLAIDTVEGYKTIAKELDRLSDLLCRIIDLADFVRSTHPNLQFQIAAHKAHMRMFDYMNTLNTTTGLNAQLKYALANPEVVSSWTEEEKIVAKILKEDFSKSAIDLPATSRESFVNLSSDISALGSEFVDSMRPEKPDILLEHKQLKGLNPMIIDQLEKRRGKVVLPTTGIAARQAIKYVIDETVRRDIYIASRTAALSQVRILEELLRKRAELAKLSGYSSYSRMTLADKMAKSPEAVNKFLGALSADNSPRIQKELQQLLQIRKTATKSTTENRINAWDREHYRLLLYDSTQRASRKPDFLPAFFSLGTVMQGLSRLFSRLYGVRFTPRESEPGETWHPDVRRLDVIDETSGRIAVIYCDLFARAGKNPNPAHFTLRCSRHIPSFEIAEATSALPPYRHDPISAPVLANDGMAVSAPAPDGSVYQLPTIALICDFPSPPPQRPGSHNQPALLSFSAFTTLFHEMGHAIHSVLGRTALQNVAGTRCATDLAELPSVLMESFATDPAVLALFARHWETDAPLPYEMVRSYLDTERTGRAADTETQICLAVVDQAFHSEAVGAPDWEGSTAAYHGVCDQWGSVPEPRGTRWQGFFGHLVGYGGSYYAYLFDRAIAGRVWERVFDGGREGGALSRENGERLRREVLGWGGSRDGWKCVGGVLGEEDLAEGGERAMERVGRWGVGG